MIFPLKLLTTKLLILNMNVTGTQIVVTQKKFVFWVNFNALTFVGKEILVFDSLTHCYLNKHSNTRFKVQGFEDIQYVEYVL